jgi:DNA mismatch endonuclease (patch repair protein)
MVFINKITEVRIDEPVIKGPRYKASNGFTTSPERGALMSKIRSQNTSAEVLLRKKLWKNGVRFRKNYKSLPGKPDIVITKNKLVIFIDGEFWHGYNWEIKKRKLIANREFWVPKIERNMQRDRINNEKLSEMGFKVLRFWESDIKKRLENCIDKILSYCK